jgi:hypothetical protein
MKLLVNTLYSNVKNTGSNSIYFSTSFCSGLGQIEPIKYFKFSFTLASYNSIYS